MKPIQPHTRYAGRNANEKSANQLARVYDSNGPGVKIRGVAQTVAEKYLQLARDAHVASDPVMAECYLQHAEHYFRLFAATQRAQTGTHGAADEVDADDVFAPLPDRFALPRAGTAQAKPFLLPQKAASGDR